MRQAIAILSLLLFSCAQENSSVQFLEDPSATETSETTAFPGVVRVVGPQGRGLCTGTLINARAILTASHCVIRSGFYQVITDFGTFGTADVVRLGAGTLNDHNDIALLIFSSRIALDKNVIPIHPEYSIGESVTLVGFGCNDLNIQSGTNVKRTGRNRIRARSNFIELATPLKNRSAQRSLLGPDNLTGTCFGDSGGPLLKSNGNGYSVVGVVHGGSWNTDHSISLYSDLSNQDNWEFLDSVSSTRELSLTHACESGANNIPYCQKSFAATGIVSALKWLFERVFGWLSL